MSSHPKWQTATVAESSKRLAVLYLEDNEASFGQAKRSLENAGFAVLSATDSWQALALLLKTPIRLVMGGDLLCREEGTDLAARIKEIQPGIAVVVRSRIVPSSMRGVDFFIGADEPWPNFLAGSKELLRSPVASGYGLARHLNAIILVNSRRRGLLEATP